MSKLAGAQSGKAFRFNGVHLRLEADASRWIAANGGIAKTWDSYVVACQVRRLLSTRDSSALNPGFRRGLISSFHSFVILSASPFLPM